MNKEQIMQVIHNKSLPDSCKNVGYLETANSWVILSDHFAFKIPKPYQATGEDLTDVEDRKVLCYKEFELNKMLTTKVYEGVVPIKKVGIVPVGINESRDEVVDYALKMKRLDDSRKLTENIKRGEITFALIDKIVAAIADFHQKTKIVHRPVGPKKLQDGFNEIIRCSLFVQEFLGEQYKDTLRKSIIASGRFLNKHEFEIIGRYKLNMIREIHGNLSAEKIYLYSVPIIVDRNIVDDFSSQMDILFDIARLGIDFDTCGMHEYDQLLFTEYVTRIGDKADEQTRSLYNYYKLYHTNLLITKKIDQTTIFNWSDDDSKYLKGLFNLYSQYLSQLRN